MKIGVLLSGSGVYDGSEIHESVLTLLALDQHNVEVVCIAPDIDQYHVINHINGEEMKEKRNVLTESARIARGDIKALDKLNSGELDGLAIPGGFGTAKNHTTWAISGPEGDINEQVKKLIVDLVNAGKPIAAMCMGPTTVAKALQDTGIHTHMTVGTTEAKSPYDIAAVSAGMETIGVTAEMREVNSIYIDHANKIISSPCYMMEASISQVYDGITQTISTLVEMVMGH